MHCDTIRELFDDLEGHRVGACLEAESLEHLESCMACQAAFASHRQVTRALRELPSPMLPQDLLDVLDGRIAGIPVAPMPPARVRSHHRGTMVVAFAATALFSVFLGVAAPWIVRGPATAPSAAVVATNAGTAEVYPDLDGVTATVSGRYCLPSSSSLHVAQGKEVDVMVSLNSPRALENAKVHVVLPPGLSFSAKAHPQQEDKQVMTVHDNLPRGDKDFKFRVKGSRVGKWDVVAVVEAGDSVVVSNATVEVSSPDDADDEERL